MTALQSRIKQELANNKGNDTWVATCASAIYNLFPADNSSVAGEILNGIVDSEGNHINGTDPKFSLGGITYGLCDKYCDISTVFNFKSFSEGATNYLLPWLALTAQLPFEAGENEIATNIISFCYALGSPMLITYSLMITILNQHWVRNKFRHLETSSPSGSQTKNVRTFLQECQQLPLRLSQQDGHLASLIILNENKGWWENLKASILATRRGVTLSLVAQILVAILSWTLTIISAFKVSLGDPSQALVLSSGSLWIWLVPVVCGWIAVGTQKDSGTISRALERDNATIVMGPNMGDQNPLYPTEAHRRIHKYSFDDQPATPNQAEASCTCQTRTLAPLSPTVTLRRNSQECSSTVEIFSDKQKALKTPLELRINPENNPLEVPNCLGFSVAGDEMQEGPAFNFARVFTWWNIAEELYGALKTTAEHLEERRDLNLRKVPRDGRPGPDDLKGDILSMLRYCKLASDVEDASGKKTIKAKEINEYPPWTELDSHFYQRIIIAIVMATFVQWGTTSAAVIIAILTKVEGIGCRSGGYLLYGVNGTISFMLIFASTIFSHSAMLRHQAIEREKRTSTKGRLDENNTMNKGTETLFPTLFRLCAVVTRFLGRTLVVLNTIWILISSMFELVGFYNNCWCEALYISKGENGWAFLVDQSNDLARSALGPWSGGVFMSVFVGVTSSAVFWLYCRGNRG